MSYSLSKEANINYICKVVAITNIRKHSNADRLQVSTIDGNNIILGLDVKQGDIGILFPLESAISSWYLSTNNLYENKALNKNPEVKGYFNDKGRVRAVSLRGEKSEGFWIPVSQLPELTGAPIGTEFDTVGDQLLVKKYVPINQSSFRSTAPKEKKQRDSKLIENQFRFHFSTPKLGSNLHQIGPVDDIVCTQKLHGTSFVVSNLLCKRKLSFWDKIAKAIGIKINESVYDNLYSSRRVLQNPDIDSGGFYKTNLYGEINAKLKDFVEPGITLYGEEIGYESNGKFIQKDYGYGLPVGTHKSYIYRITSTNYKGQVIELSWEQVKGYCQKYGLEHVPELYSGKAKDCVVFTDFLKNLQDKYLGKLLDNGVPDEGICIRKDIGLETIILKLKDSAFLQKESKDLDKGEVSIEEEN